MNNIVLNKQAFLSKKIFRKNIEYIPTRNGYGNGLLMAGKKNKQVVALCADLSDSTRTNVFAKEFPERFVQVGVAEQLLATIGAGMAAYGKIPFIASYAAFSPGRNWEQIRTTIALNDVPVKIVGCHAGVSVGPDGATHQALEDIATMRAIPNMIVLSPCDAIEAEKATIAAAQIKKPVYLRFAREKTPVFTTKKSPFSIGKANILTHGTDLTIIGTGPLLYEALIGAKLLAREGITAQVINCHTIKPLDTKTILTSIQKTRALISVEEHQIMGGLGSALSELLAVKAPTPMEFVGIPDKFGQSGKPEELLEEFCLTASHIVRAAKRVLKRKYV